MHSEKSDVIQVNSSNSYIYENIPICTNETKENPPFGLVIYKVIIVHTTIDLLITWYVTDVIKVKTFVSFRVTEKWY